MIDDHEEITVCASCSRACCWAGIFYCDDYQTAEIKTITKGEARELRLEHEDYIQSPEVQVCAS